MLTRLRILVHGLLIASLAVGSNGADFVIDITFSDDGLALSLPLFLLQLYETDGNLSQPAIGHVQRAADNFLLPEMNKIFAPQHTVDFVNTTVLSQQGVELSNRFLLPKEKREEPTKREKIDWEMHHGSLDTERDEETFLRGKRNLETLVGSELLLMINVTFDRVPTPTVRTVSDTLSNIMQDLSNFLSNLTAFEDPDLEFVYLALRLELPTPEPSAAPSSYPSSAPTSITSQAPSFAPSMKNAVGVPTNAVSGLVNSRGGSVTNTVIISSVLVATVAILLGTYLLWRRRRNDDVSEKDGLFDLQSDLESSMSRSLPPTPNMATTPIGAAPLSPIGEGNYTAGDSVFSGITDIMTDTGSPRVIPQVKSMSSATTIKANNMGPSTPSPNSAGNSLFAFSEGDEENSPGMRSSDVSDSDTDGAASPHGSSPRSRSPIGYGPAQLTESSEYLSAHSNLASSSASATQQVLPSDTGSSSTMKASARGYGQAQLTESSEYLSAQSTMASSSGSATHQVLPPGTRSSPTIKASTARTEEFVFEENNVDELIETPLRRNTAATTPRSQSSSKLSIEAFGPDDDMDENLPYSWDPVRNNPAGSLVAGGVVAATADVAVARRSKRAKDKDRTEYNVVGNLGVPIRTDGAFPSLDSDDRTGRRRHVDFHGKEDGTSAYQNAMHPLDWSNKSEQTDDDSTLSSGNGGALGQYRDFVYAHGETAHRLSQMRPVFSPTSQGVSTLSEQTTGSRSSTGSSQISASRQLINDLVWLEKKIADVKGRKGQGSMAFPTSPGNSEHADSLSYVSNDALISPSSNEEEAADSQSQIMRSIVCRDCYAPPGKLQIVIHSTKDGPAVHTVKPGSSLEGHIFSGDLIIAVDNVDTRTFTAEQVMKMMAAKSGFERKITVLHFED